MQLLIVTVVLPSSYILPPILYETKKYTADAMDVCGISYNCTWFLYETTVAIGQQAAPGHDKMAILASIGLLWRILPFPALVGAHDCAGQFSSA